jgi:hypothetical protein
MSTLSSFILHYCKQHVLPSVPHVNVFKLFMKGEEFYQLGMENIGPGRSRGKFDGETEARWKVDELKGG